MRRRPAGLSFLASLVTATALVAGPLATTGHAATSTTLSDVATAVGRVTGTVTSDASYVQVQLATGQQVLADTVRPVPLDTRAVPFDLPTWGFPDSATLQVATCATAEETSCGAPVTSQAVAPVDATATVTWPTDATVGQESGPYTVTVADPDGGGILRARWTAPGETFDSLLALARNGTTELPLPDGDLDLTVERCAAQGYPCRTYPELGNQVRVNRTITARVEDISPQFVGPDDTPAADIRARLWIPEGTNLTAQLQVHTWATDAVVPGVGTTVTGLVPDASGYVTIPVDLTGLGTGTYALAGTISYDDPDFGHLTGPILGRSFTVDASDPVISSVHASASSIYPAVDGYRDTVTFHTTASDNNPVRSRYEIRDAAGTLVRTLNTPTTWSENQATWNGRTGSGASAPAGRYTVTTTVTDQYGNATTATQPLTLDVSDERLVAHTFTRTVTARDSLVAKHVGRCSTLALPSARGWAGSMGLYAGTRCQGNVDATLVSTSHAIRMPAAFRYDTLRVSAYGGAAKAAPRSLAYLTYLHPKSGWKNDTRMGTALGTHGGATVKAGGYVYEDRSFAWGAYTAGPARYDIKGFTIRLTYTTLE